MDARRLETDLRVEEARDGTFMADGGPGTGRMFGGLLVGQAVAAAAATVAEERAVHAVHASFVRGGRAGEPVHYEVERTRDGGAFSTRRVTARQGSEVRVVLSADFHALEHGPDYEVPAGPPLPPPEALPVGRYDTRWFESRDVPPAAPGRPPHARAAWFRARLPVPADPRTHQHALVMLTDHGPTRAVREPHVESVDVERRFSVSLDHSVWLHRPVRVDDWLAYELVPMATAGGRGLAIGAVRTRAGELVATVAQEALLRFDT